MIFLILLSAFIVAILIVDRFLYFVSFIAGGLARLSERRRRRQNKAHTIAGPWAAAGGRGANRRG